MYYSFEKKIGGNIHWCATAVTKTTEFRIAQDDVNTEKMLQIRLQISYIPSHAFGEHEQ